ncbi:hypothetical protein HDV00_009409 [Rhizophlyctis rosea]|nr:hypothetical protein HDV00_009409 [Rhizophlyctis rosea]
MSFPRSMILPPGTTFNHPEIGDIVHYKDTYHESEKVFFPHKPLTCDECFKTIEPGTLASEGTREWYPDAPYQLTHPTTDIVHYEHYFKEQYGPIRDQIRTRPHEIKGWVHLSDVEKRDILTKLFGYTDETEIQTSLSHTPPFTSLTLILCGEFPRSKEDLTSHIESRGGMVVQTVTAKTDLCVLGEDGTTAYGGKTGKGSKKYKEVKKRKVPVVSGEWLEGALEFDGSVADVVGRFKKGEVVVGGFDKDYGVGDADGQAKADDKESEDKKGDGTTGEAEAASGAAGVTASDALKEDDTIPEDTPTTAAPATKKRTRKPTSTTTDAHPPTKRVTRSSARTK